VFKSGNVFESGHYMHLNGPIALGHDTAIRAVAFAHDPELASIDTPNGHVDFLQVVGITEDEQTAFKRWNTLAALEVLAPSLPLLVTDLERASLLRDPSLAAALEAGSAREGSRTGYLFLERVAWQRRKRLLRAAHFELEIGAGQVPELTALLPARLPFGRRLLLVGHDARAEFLPGSQCAIAGTAEGLQVTLDATACAALVASLRPMAGTYRVPGFDAFALVVRTTEIRDNDGQLLEVIG
jgi:suppressor of fused-like protein